MKIFDILGLSTVEQQIMETTHAPVLQIDIARRIKVARTALYPYLDNLTKKGFLNIRKKGKRVLYQAKTETEIRNTVLESMLDIDKSSPITLPGVDVYIGKKAIKEIWTLLGNQPRQSRVIALQPTAALKLALQKVPLEISRKNHSFLIKNKIIVEQLAESDVYDHVKGFLDNMGQLEAVQPDFEGRTTSTTIFPANSFPSQSELFIFIDSVLVVDWDKEIAFRFYSQEAVALFKTLIEYAKLQGKLTDNVAHMKKEWSK